MRTILHGCGLPAVCLFTVFAALVVHEAGHAAVACLTGGHIVDVVLFSSVPHIRVAGIGSAGAQALRALAGSGLVAGVTFTLLMIYGWSRSVIITTLGLFSIADFIGWVSAALFPDGEANDAADFMAHTGLSGDALALICCALAAASVLLIARRSKRRNLLHC